MQQFQVNDWCFCEYKLQQIISIEDGRITEVSDGRFRLSSYELNDRCFPLDLRIKNISDTVAYYMDELHKIKTLNLNYPDLNREFISRWVELCKVKDNDAALKEGHDRLSAFYNQIRDEIRSMNSRLIEGVQLFR